MKNALPKEVWFLTSELEGERASSFRQERWCRIFLGAGARIRIFNLRGAFGLSDVSCSNERDLLEFRQRALAAMKPTASVREGFAVRFIRRIKHLLLIDLYLPNVVRLLFLAHHALSHSKQPVVLMASSPPFSVAVVGAILKHWHGDKVVFAVDMRDAWALHNALGGVKAIKRKIERAVLRAADYVSTVSKWLADEFKQTYSVDVFVAYNVATHYLDAPNPKEISWSEICPELDNKRLKLIYTGSTPEGHYDLSSIVGGVVTLRSRFPELADKLQLVFVGACDEVRREAESQGVTQKDMVFVGHLPHVLSRAVQAKADILLFLAHYGDGNKGVVSTKLFEYLCLGKPVLPLSLHQDADVDQLLLRYCGKSVNVHNRDEFVDIFAQIAAGGCGGLPHLTDKQKVWDLLNDYISHASRLLDAAYTPHRS